MGLGVGLSLSFGFGGELGSGFGFGYRGGWTCGAHSRCASPPSYHRLLLLPSACGIPVKQRSTHMVKSGETTVAKLAYVPAPAMKTGHAPG